MVRRPRRDCLEANKSMRACNFFLETLPPLGGLANNILGSNINIFQPRSAHNSLPWVTLKACFDMNGKQKR